MSHKKTVNTLKTRSNQSKPVKKTKSITHKSQNRLSFKVLSKPLVALLAQVKRLVSNSKIHMDISGVQKFQSWVKRTFKQLQHTYAADTKKKADLFTELETNDVILLFKSNKKAAAAALSAVLAFLVGFGSFSFYAFSPESAKTELAAKQKNETEISLNKVSTPAMALASAVDKQSTLSKLSGLLDYGPLFESERMCYILSVNAKPIAYFKTRAEGQALLDAMLNETKNDSTKVMEVGFAEKVTLEAQMVSMYKFRGYSDVAETERLIRTGALEKKVYNVQSGDVLSTIAESNNMTLSQLYAANPGIESKKYLQIGEEINLVVPKPLINVQSVIRVTYSNAIPYETTKETSSKLYKGETSVKVKGSSGEMKIRAEITKVNGVEVKRVILSEEVVKKPVARVLAVGTKEAPPTIGSGKFAKPVSRGYTISSPFGRRWGSFHTGIDLAMPSGSAVFAADGGTVVFAGRQSSYGKLVVISHGGNTESYYAHNSSLLVKRGDKVFKGQKIALSGNTGRSTGPHLHFEVRVNGVPKNPTKFVRF